MPDRFVVWELWPTGWQAMTLPLSFEDACEMSGLSDAETCRILREGREPADV